MSISLTTWEFYVFYPFYYFSLFISFVLSFLSRVVVGLNIFLHCDQEVQFWRSHAVLMSPEVSGRLPILACPRHVGKISTFHDVGRKCNLGVLTPC